MGTPIGLEAIAATLSRQTCLLIALIGGMRGTIVDKWTAGVHGSYVSRISSNKQPNLVSSLYSGLYAEMIRSCSPTSLAQRHVHPADAAAATAVVGVPLLVGPVSFFLS